MRLGRPIRLALLGLVGLTLTYVVGANLFLSSEWGRAQLNRRPEKLAIEWTRAWTLLPGLVHVKDLELKGRARRATWQAEMHQGHLWIWLPSLIKRHLRLVSGAATGSSVAVEVQPAPDDPRPPRQRRGWRISIDRLDLCELTSLRFNDYSLEGDGRLRGAARFEVGGPMAFDISQLSFHRARVLAADFVAADTLTLDAALEIEEISIGEATVLDLLAGTSGDIELEAEASNLGFLTTYLGRFPWIDIGGAGHLVLDLEMSDGWLAPGSSLDFTGPAVSATYLGLTALGAGEVRGRVPEGAGHIQIEAAFESYGVERQIDNSPLLEGDGLMVTVSNDSTAIDRPAEGVSVSVRMPAARVPNLAALDVYLPESAGLALTAGTAAISAEIDYSATEQAGHGWLRLAGEQIVATFDDSQVQADVLLEARFPQVQLEAGILAVDGTTLDIDGVRVLAGDAFEDSEWWCKMRVPNGTLTRRFGLEASEKAVITGSLVAELLNTSPLTALLKDRIPRLGWFDELLTIEDVELESDFRLAGAQVQLRGVKVQGGAKDRLDLQAELDLHREGAEGLVFAAWGPLSAAVALADDGRDWKLTRSRQWYAEQAAAYRTERTTEPPPAAKEEDVSPSSVPDSR